MLMYMVIFFLGMMAGAVGVMVISCLVVDSMNKRKRELTKEEWKMGIHPDHVDGGLYVVAYMVTAVIVFAGLMYVLFGNR